MDFLRKVRIHHGDLASRNILLGDNLTAKISDFGLARCLEEDSCDLSDYYGGSKFDPFDAPKIMLPMKWLAPEILNSFRVVLEKSDVWSFGVLTWEIFMLGKEPYQKGR